jgi:hypothetical protein
MKSHHFVTTRGNIVKELTLHPDAMALQFPKLDAIETSPVVVKPLYRHGDKNHATTIWYWNAGSVEPQKPASAPLIDANGPDQKLKFREAGDLTAAEVWNQVQWKVMFTRSREISDGG